MDIGIASTVKQKILQIEEGNLFTINDFDDLNSDNVVMRTLSRLQKEEKIVRVATGIYMNPKMTKFGILFPTIDTIAHKIAERDRAQIMPTGSTALNLLGLSTQVPMNAVYITNGSKRRIKVGKRNIVFKNAVQKNFQYKGKLLPLIIIALKELGEKNVTDNIIEKITNLIHKSDLQEQKSMMHDLYLAPTWIKELLYPIINQIVK